MERGTVKWFDKEKGYGFLQSNAGKEYFVHKSKIIDDDSGLDQGQMVEFEIAEGRKGPEAANVRSLVEDQG